MYNGDPYLIKLYMIKFVIYLQQVSSFLWVILFFPHSKKSDHPIMRSTKNDSVNVISI